MLRFTLLCRYHWKRRQGVKAGPKRGWREGDITHNSIGREGKNWNRSLNKCNTNVLLFELIDKVKPELMTKVHTGKISICTIGPKYALRVKPLCGLLGEQYCSQHYLLGNFQTGSFFFFLFFSITKSLDFFKKWKKNELNCTLEKSPLFCQMKKKKFQKIHKTKNFSLFF